MAWVLISSELDYYSKWFGPQILLEMAIAFNLPSIPVLIISGQVGWRQRPPEQCTIRAQSIPR